MRKHDAIYDFEEFLLADLPSKIFPKDEVLSEVKGVDWYREDPFENKKDVEEYITQHFKLFKEEFQKENKGETKNG